MKSIKKEISFFTDVLECKVTHQEEKYTNIDFFGSQVTLKEIPEVNTKLQELHFGVNLNLLEFEDYTKRILESKYDGILTHPTIVDVDNEMERRKMYLKSPSGYIFEIKGYGKS